MSSRKIDLDLEDIRAEIIYHHFRDIDVKTFLVTFDVKRKALSTLDGFKEVEFVGNHYNPPQLWDFLHNNKKDYEEKIYADLKVNSDDIAMLFTGAMKF